MLQIRTIFIAFILQRDSN